MKLSAALLPADAANLLDTVQAQLAGLEALQAEALEERLLSLRSWLAESAATLRKADGRGKAEPAQKAPTDPRETERRLHALAVEKGQAKKPCGCGKPPPPPMPPPPREADPLSWLEIGGAVARRFFGGNR